MFESGISLPGVTDGAGGAGRDAAGAVAAREEGEEAR
jgi:hypothetical protein